MTKEELRNAYQATPEYKALIDATEAADYASRTIQFDNATWLAVLSMRNVRARLLDDTPEMKAWNKMLSELRATDDD